jgi:hypothetical protein
MIMMSFGAPAFVIGVAACPETLRHHARLKKYRKIAVDCIPRDLEPLFFETGNKNVDVEMSALALDPLDKLKALPRQTAPLAADKTFEFFLIFDHEAKLLLFRLSLNKKQCSGQARGCQ